MKKYIFIYNGRNVLLSLLFATIAFIPLYSSAMNYDYVSNDLLLSFLPFAIAALYVVIASLFTIRFRSMIKKQEKNYGIVFNDTRSEHLERMIYLSKDWLIFAGVYAFYKRYIKSVTYILKNVRGGPSYKVTIKTIDNKCYKISCRNLSGIKKIRKWKTVS